MSSLAAAQRTLGRTLPPWWLFLLTSIGWMLVALILLRFVVCAGQFSARLPEVIRRQP